MNPMLDPKRDLAGATPEALARALLRPLRGGVESRHNERKDDAHVRPRSGERPGGEPGRAGAIDGVGGQPGTAVGDGVRTV